jgi:putative ATPase
MADQFSLSGNADPRPGKMRPLADRIRPRSLDEYVGQAHLRDRLTTFLKAERPPSILFFGPPGCGKSTLALLFAQAVGGSHIRVSAPEAGLSELRKRLKGASVLVLDELHRFSKAQQDFFLPVLESGEILLLATTTENPSFSVTRQLLSRLHVLKLTPLGAAELGEVARRGLKTLGISLPEKSVDVLTRLSGGDARTLLNLIEYSAELPPKQQAPAEIAGHLPELLVRGDRTGDSHYELASALIKSIRGSDPDAAVYYLACLLEGGEDPRFICRRLILSASEDVGLADPHALPLAVACQQAVEFVGMPEGFIPLAETVVYLAVAKKSNASYIAYKTAAHEIQTKGKEPVPLHLRNPVTKLMKEWGYGKDYKYPHDYPGAWVEEDYLPDALVGRTFYTPKDEGEEPKITAWWRGLKKKA